MDERTGILLKFINKLQSLKSNYEPWFRYLSQQLFWTSFAYQLQPQHQAPTNAPFMTESEKIIWDCVHTNVCVWRLILWWGHIAVGRSKQIFIRAINAASNECKMFSLDCIWRVAPISITIIFWRNVFIIAIGNRIIGRTMTVANSKASGNNGWQECHAGGAFDSNSNFWQILLNENEKRQVNLWLWYSKKCLRVENPATQWSQQTLNNKWLWQFGLQLIHNLHVFNTTTTTTTKTAEAATTIKMKI